MVSLLQAIPIDVLEMVIVSSRDYELFEQLQKVLIKLRQPNRVSRINDKLTITYVNIGEYIYKYYLNGKIHREYDKPAEIFNGGSIQFYLNDIRCRKNDCFTYCNSNGDRYWRKNDKEHRENDLPREIYYTGRNHGWEIDGLSFREKNKPYCVTIDGNRYYNYIDKCTNIFKFL